MMWKEFEELAGYEVSYETYSTIIEPMYMAVPDSMSKQEFVKLIDKKAVMLPPKPSKATLIKKMKKEAEHLWETCEHYTDYDSRDRLNALARQYAELYYGYDANNLDGVFFYLHEEYAFPALQRGCRFPDEIRICSGNGTLIESKKLVNWTLS